MISLSRNKRPIYVCPITINNSIATYGSPQKLYENYQITNTQADMKTFGLDAYKYIRIKTNASHLKYYHLGDRVYINNTPPEMRILYVKTQIMKFINHLLLHLTN